MEKVKKIFNEYKMILLMNVIIFAALFFGIGQLVGTVKPLFWRILFVLIVIIITDIFYILKKIKYEHVLVSLPILFILNLIFIRYCTIRDLYGITSHGKLDKCPAILDALMVDLIIIMIEYITLLVTRFIINKMNKK